MPPSGIRLLVRPGGKPTASNPRLSNINEYLRYRRLK
jgi:hypothetical protein